MPEYTLPLKDDGSLDTKEVGEQLYLIKGWERMQHILKSLIAHGKAEGLALRGSELQIALLECEIRKVRKDALDEAARAKIPVGGLLTASNLRLAIRNLEGDE